MAHDQLLHLTQGSLSLRVKANGGFTLELSDPAPASPGPPDADACVWRVDSGKHLGCIRGRSASGKAWRLPLCAHAVVRTVEAEMLGVGMCTIATVSCAPSAPFWCGLLLPRRATMHATVTQLTQDPPTPEIGFTL
jgi:hypothetical protein